MNPDLKQRIASFECIASNDPAYGSEARHLLRSCLSHIEEQEKVLKLACQDSTEDDTALRKIAAEIIGPERSEHDGYAVIPIVNVMQDVVNTLQSKLTTILTDKNYEGGVQYWIHQHDTLARRMAESLQKTRTKLTALVEERNAELRKTGDRLLELRLERNELKKRNEQLEREAGQMRKALEESLRQFLQCGFWAEPTRIKIRQSLATTSGKGYRSPEEFAALEERINKADTFANNLGYSRCTTPGCECLGYHQQREEPEV